MSTGTARAAPTSVGGGARPGAINLSHDIHKPTVQTMPTALDGLIERGFRIAIVSMILGARDRSKLR